MDFTPTPIVNFDQTLRDFVIRNEGKKTLVNGVKVYLPHNQVVIDDVVGVPTLGYGYALVVKDSTNRWVAKDFAKINQDLAGTSIQLMPNDYTALQELTENLNTGATISQMQTLLGDKKAGGNLAFTLTDAGATTLLDNGLTEAKAAVRSQFVKWLGPTDGQSLFDQIQGSKEFVAATDMAYQVPGLVGPELTRRLFESPRFDVADEMLFRSNANQLKGYTERNFRRVAMFGPATNDAELDAFLTYMDGTVPALSDYMRGQGFTAQQIFERVQEGLINKALEAVPGLSDADVAAHDAHATDIYRNLAGDVGIRVVAGNDGTLGTADALKTMNDDRPVLLPIDAHLADTDSSENLSVSIPKIDAAGDGETLPMSKRLLAEAETLIAAKDSRENRPAAPSFSRRSCAEKKPRPAPWTRAKAIRSARTSRRAALG